jgi:hypothetical protein
VGHRPQALGLRHQGPYRNMGGDFPGRVEMTVGRANVNLTPAQVRDGMPHTWTGTDMSNRLLNMTLLIKVRRLGISRRTSGSGDAPATVFIMEQQIPRISKQSPPN